MLRKPLFAVGLTFMSIIFLMALLPTPVAPARPAGRHCGDVGPLPGQEPGFCGCTWGEVLFRGQPVPGAVVTLTFAHGIVTDITQLTSLEPSPYFDLSGYELGAQRGDVFTLTAQFNDQVLTRTVRAWPESDGEQHVVLAFAEHGLWQPWLTDGYTQSLAADGSTIWAAGSTGVVSINLTSGVSVAQNLPGSNQAVRALAINADQHVWAVTGDGVAEFDGTQWHTHTVPLAGPARAIATSATGTVWVGSGDAMHGQIAEYTGAWTVTGSFDAPVMALAVDPDGSLWAGTWGDGVYRQRNNGSWVHYQAANGLASDYIWTIATSAAAVWFGTEPYWDSGRWHGGVGRYELATGLWRVYTSTHGLPRDTLFPQAPASVFTLIVVQDGTIWAGTPNGVYSFVNDGWWSAYTSTHGLRTGPTRALAASHNTLIAGISVGLDRLDEDLRPGQLPTVSIDLVTPLTLTFGQSLTLQGRAQDMDEDGARIVAQEWTSSLNGPLCTTLACVLPYSLFTSGTHVLSWRAQDDEGMWSSPLTATLIVKELKRVYLPLLARP